MSDNVIFFPGYLFVDGHYLHHAGSTKPFTPWSMTFPKRTISARLLGTCGECLPNQTATIRGHRGNKYCS